MIECKTTRTIEEITGYYAEDGKYFKDKAECEKHEQTAKMVIYNDFKRLIVGGDTFAECNIWERFGYGGEEYELAVIEIKDKEDLRIANMYGEINKKGTPLTEDVIGKRVLIDIGDTYCRDASWRPRTEEELIEMFKEDIKKFFHPEENKKEA